MYRPEIKVLDCTIRDGGLMNNWGFDKALVKDVFEGLVAAGVDYVELGYRADKKMFPPTESGIWRYCDEEDVRDVAFKTDATKISIMCDVGRTDYDAFLPASDSVISMVRVATYTKDIDKAIHLGQHVHDLGYETTCNIMAISHVLEPDLDEALDELAKAKFFKVVYLVDSFGYFYSEQVQYLAEKYLNKLKPAGMEIGIHAHNNLQLGFGNTIEAIIRGVNYLDGTIYGMGRAAGNCPLELLVDFLKNPKFDSRPILDLVQKYFVKMKTDLRWGYEIPYAITGLLNKHPRAALAFMKGAHGDSFREFYDKLLEAEE
ncbi:MAG: aldolase catalytic domain-containing protein [Candidatus Hydrogenedentes bacterium]|nr:aldolase catalytic domain-containing protein [Candidatus Hydrogenedentota bacterium]